MDFQFYPTGAKTAALMWNKFRRPIRHVCDISAGKGHLFRHAKNGFAGVPDESIPWLAGVEDDIVQESGRVRRFSMKEAMRQRFDRIPEISAVEIDIRHHGDLKDVGARIIGHDFFEVRSLATVTQVIANPPFRNGEDHILHAWEILYDAEIVAIINAASIRNPCTRQRQRLLELIERHGSVEFLQDQFVDEVERKTDVEVALIYLEKVPASMVDMSAILHDLRVDAGLTDQIDAATEVGTALALPENFITNTYTRFQLAVQAARRASEAQAVMENLSDGLGMSLDQMQAKGVGNEVRLAQTCVRERANSLFKERYERLKRNAWAQIIRSSLITDKVSNQARKKLEAQAASIYELEFSVANVHGLLHGLAQSMGEIYSDMVLDLFDAMIGRDTDNAVFYRAYKSNDKHRIGMRIRKSRIILPRVAWSHYSGLCYESKGFLSDVDKVFGYLMGQTESYDGIVQAIGTAQKHDVGQAKRLASRYFEFRYYSGTQTLHLYPKDPQVLDRMNRFVGRLRQWLPQDMGEANADFVHQYEKAETLHKEYVSVLCKKSSFVVDHEPVRNLLRHVAGRDHDHDGVERGLHKLDDAIEAVHACRGIHCGPALEGHASEQLLKAPDEQKDQPVQLLLAA